MKRVLERFCQKEVLQRAAQLRRKKAIYMDNRSAWLYQQNQSYYPMKKEQTEELEERLKSCTRNYTQPCMYNVCGYYNIGALWQDFADDEEELYDILKAAEEDAGKEGYIITDEKGNVL